MLVLGGSDDKIFSRSEARATARTYNAELQFFHGMTHDMMLESDWQSVADRIITWLKGVPGIC
jgi:alpha-beta hydrolase superfamily lysophospholipase